MTRLPVYENTLDTPLGLVHLKDFALSHGFNGTGERYNLKKMLRPLIYAPPSMPLAVLLQKMQSERTHMALVIDEYGGVDGLVTIEDLVEQVVGEIEDEHDTEEERLLGGREARLLSRAGPHPAGGFRGRDRPAAGRCRGRARKSTRWAGWSSCLPGGCRARGEVIVHDSGVEFEVVEADPRRIKRLGCGPRRWPRRHDPGPPARG
jgi:magnesium and cobalt transporter